MWAPNARSTGGPLEYSGSTPLFKTRCKSQATQTAGDTCGLSAIDGGSTADADPRRLPETGSQIRRLVDEAIQAVYLTKARRPISAVTRRVLEDLQRLVAGPETGRPGPV